MDIQIIEGSHGGLQVIIKCEKVNEEVLSLKSHINRFRGKLTAKRDHETVFVELSEVLYFESVDNRTFLYTSDEVMEIKYRLYELEEMLPPEDFFRISKAQIVNINRVKTLAPGFNRTLFATMTNGEQVYISRKYAVDLRRALSI